VEIFILVFDHLQFLKSESIPKSHCAIFTDSDDLLLFVEDVNIQDVPPFAHLRLIGDTESVRVDREHESLSTASDHDTQR